MRKESEFKQKILTDLGELESVERRWLAGILGGIIVGAINLTIFLQYLWEILNGQPATIPRIPFVVLVATTAVLLAMNLLAFAGYFSLSLSFRLSVGRGMVIKKRSRLRSAEDNNPV